MLGEARLGGGSAALLLLFDLEGESSVDVWENTTTGDGGTDEGIKFFVTADGELEMARGCMSRPDVGRCPGWT